MKRQGTGAAACALVTGALLLIGCGESAATTTVPPGGPPARQDPPPSPEEIARAENRRKTQETARKLLGRWEVNFLVDIVFIDDGTCLVDGPGPTDLSVQYEVVAPDRIAFIEDDTRSECRVSFFENKVRLTTLSGKGAGIEGGTYTRK